MNLNFLDFTKWFTSCVKLANFVVEDMQRKSINTKEFLKTLGDYSEGNAKMAANTDEEYKQAEINNNIYKTGIDELK